MTNLDKEAKRIAERIGRDPPSEESIEQYHAKTPEQLEQLMPSDLEQSYIIAPDGREMLITDYIAEFGTKEQQTADKRGRILDRMKRRVKRMIKTPGGDTWTM